MTSIQSLVELNGLIQQVRQAARSLKQVDKVAMALTTAVRALEDATDTILEANTLDLEASLEMAVPDLVIEWLKLTPERIKTAIIVIERLANMDAATGLVCSAPIGTGSASHAYWLGEPLGVVALVYEALPELAIIAAGLCLRTGNGLILKGGHEASQTNQAIADVFQTVLAQAGLQEQAILSISPSEGEAARRWLMQTSGLDLVIPYGRASLVQQVVREANSPSLSTAIGNCYLYWARSASAERVANIILDSHVGIPEPVNGVEKILVDAQIAPAAVEDLQNRLQIGNLSAKEANVPDLLVSVNEDDLWRKGQLDHSVLVGRIPDLATAIAFINRHSNGHADCIVTDSYQESVQFANQIRSASIHVNTSPRFRRNAAQSSNIALGMSAQRSLKGGRITLEALLTQKLIVKGLG